VLVPRQLAAPAATGAPFRAFAALLAAPPASDAELHAALVNLVIEDSPFPKLANAQGDTLPWALLAHVNLPVRDAQVGGQAFIEADPGALKTRPDAEMVANGVRPLAFNLWHWQHLPK